MRVGHWTTLVRRKLRLAYSFLAISLSVIKPINQDILYDGPANDIWSLGILLVKLLGIQHPFIDIDTDTESIAKGKIIKADPEYYFQPEHIGRGRAASLIIQMLELDPQQRLTVSHHTE